MRAAGRGTVSISEERWLVDWRNSRYTRAPKSRISSTSSSISGGDELKEKSDNRAERGRFGVTGENAKDGLSIVEIAQVVLLRFKDDEVLRELKAVAARSCSGTDDRRRC